MGNIGAYNEDLALSWSSSCVNGECLRILDARRTPKSMRAQGWPPLALFRKRSRRGTGMFHASMGVDGSRTQKQLSLSRRFLLG